MPPSIVGNWGSIVVYCKLELARCVGGLIGAAWCLHVLCAQWGEGSADCRESGLERIQITTISFQSKKEIQFSLIRDLTGVEFPDREQVASLAWKRIRGSPVG